MVDWLVVVRGEGRVEKRECECAVGAASGGENVAGCRGRTDIHPAGGCSARAVLLGACARPLGWGLEVAGERTNERAAGVGATADGWMGSRRKMGSSEANGNERARASRREAGGVRLGEGDGRPLARARAINIPKYAGNPPHAHIILAYTCSATATLSPATLPREQPLRGDWLIIFPISTPTPPIFPQILFRLGNHGYHGIFPLAKENSSQKIHLSLRVT